MGWRRPGRGKGDEQVEAGGGSRTGTENRFLFTSEGSVTGWGRVKRGRVRAGQRQSLEKTH